MSAGCWPGLSNGLMRRGRDLVLTTVPPGQDDLTMLRHLIDSQRVDGIVMHRVTQDDPCVRFLLERDIPFVTLGRMLAPHAPHPWFDMDAETAFCSATQTLLDLGHRDFAVFGPSEPYSYAAIRRLGVERALAGAGLTLPPHRVIKAPVPDPNAIAMAAEKLLSAPNRPTAVLAILDKYALAIVEAAHRLNLSVPDDLSVIGFGDIPQAEFSNPPLSTFRAALAHQWRDDRRHDRQPHRERRKIRGAGAGAGRLRCTRARMVRRPVIRIRWPGSLPSMPGARSGRRHCERRRRVSMPEDGVDLGLGIEAAHIGIVVGRDAAVCRRRSRATASVSSSTRSDSIGKGWLP